MKTYALEEFESFLKIHTKDSKNILIHSAIANLGIPTKNNQKIPPQEIMDNYLEILLKCNSEILMPCFNYSFPKTHFADLRSLPSEVGILTEAYRNATKHRSIHPMFSFCSNNGESIDKSVEYNPFLGNCVYQNLLDSNALMIFLGIDIRVCTFMMFVEANFGVKYRYFKPFSGEVIDLEEISHKGEFYHFCLPPNGEIVVDYSKMFKALLSLGVVKSQKLGASFLYYFNAQDFYKAVKNELTKNPYLLLKTSPKRFWTFKNGEDTILESL
ncbi:AAC(3) family N-acetyltransferase [Helicobacter ibis]|uniref:Aminoglycoside N(3)-acetyltransferase n=1 Tax=Helicobacter ibis TaxID=2962633 RepID=A0ABT4VHA2_9HELI|nr:AAC(3) family N-acetyltransferase [Helicobacter ibis]MDA3969558.1 AAC(3) family N-acetyltransferase [Helicobacter ibis]